MPIYEYACTSCGERTEAKQRFDDLPLEECPYCGGKLRKLFSPVGVVFKGSGFYSTDARKKVASGTAKESSDKGRQAAGGGEKAGDKSGTDKSSSDKSSGSAAVGSKSEGSPGSA